MTNNFKYYLILAYAPNGKFASSRCIRLKQEESLADYKGDNEDWTFIPKAEYDSAPSHKQTSTS